MKISNLTIKQNSSDEWGQSKDRGDDALIYVAVQSKFKRVNDSKSPNGHIDTIKDKCDDYPILNLIRLSVSEQTCFPCEIRFSISKFHQPFMCVVAKRTEKHSNATD